MIRLALSSLVAAFLLLGCGHKPPSGGGGGGGGEGGEGGATVVLPDVPFEQLDHDQRIAFMKQVVVPEMKPLFQNHNPGKYAKFGCRTCHGPDADKGLFHMPSDAVPKLNFADMSRFQEVDIEWMKNEIKPTMARLLKEPEHSAENPQGFGCLHCHMQTSK